MLKDEILSTLRQNVKENGISMFTFSTDLSRKQLELDALKELESEGYIQLFAPALGYSLYRIL